MAQLADQSAFPWFQKKITQDSEQHNSNHRTTREDPRCADPLPFMAAPQYISGSIRFPDESTSLRIVDILSSYNSLQKAGGCLTYGD